MEIFLIINFDFVLFSIRFFLRKKYLLNEKRANELNDPYEYINENKNENKSNLIDNINAIIEMGVKL